MDFENVISVNNMRESDAHTIAEHTTSAELMMKAAQGIFNAVKFCGKVCVVCGKGNNGGDGYALACILARESIPCTIVRVTDGFSKDGLYFYQTAKSLGVEEISLDNAGNFTGFDIVVDCILGTGFSGEVSGDIQRAIEAINLSPAYIISADINSGLNGDTGCGDIAVNSDLTVSIGYLKTGLFLNDAPYYIDLLTNADIGIHLLEEEYMLIDYSRLSFFEGYNSDVYTIEEFFEKFGYSPKTCDIPAVIKQMSKESKRTVVVKTDHSAVIADLKYVYFCADYVKTN